MSGRPDAHPSTADTDADARIKPTPTSTVTPTPTPSPTPQSVRRRLTVNSGNADGHYYPVADVVVTANDPPRRYVFDRWHGDWEFLSNPLYIIINYALRDPLTGEPFASKGRSSLQVDWVRAYSAQQYTIRQARRVS